MNSEPSDKNEANNSPDNTSSDTILQVKCGNKHAAFYVAKCKRSGKTVGKCIKYQGRWMSPSEFESMAGVPAKKWKQSIKYGDKPLGVWLTQNLPLDSFSGASQLDSQLSTVDHDNTVGDQHLISDCPTTINIHPETDSRAACTQSRQTNCTHNEVIGLPQHAPQTASQRPAVDILESPPECGNAVLASFIETLQQNIMAAVESILQKALDSLRDSLQGQFDALTARISILEAKMAEYNSNTSASPTDGDQPPSQSQYVPSNCNLTDIEQKLELISNSLHAQQQVLEFKEREQRALNIVISGIKEPEAREDVASTVRELLRTKLDLEDVDITVAKHLGRKVSNRPGNSRLILVKFPSLETKARVMKCHSKLAGTRVFINNDLTKDQKAKEKHLRDLKRKLQSLPNYKEKRITIWRGKICIDGNPAPSSVLNEASPVPPS